MTGPVLVPIADRSGVVLDVPGWPTGVPGLVIIEAPRGVAEPAVCDGSWSVVHARSGNRLSYCMPDPEGALGLALALRDVTDWQQPAGDVREALRAGARESAVAPFRLWRCVHKNGRGVSERDNGVIA